MITRSEPTPGGEEGEYPYREDERVDPEREVKKVDTEVENLKLRKVERRGETLVEESGMRHGGGDPPVQKVNE